MSNPPRMLDDNLPSVTLDSGPPTLLQSQGKPGLVLEKVPLSFGDDVLAPLPQNVLEMAGADLAEAAQYMIAHTNLLELSMNLYDEGNAVVVGGVALVHGLALCRPAPDFPHRQAKPLA